MNYTMHIVLNDGRQLTVTGFASIEEAVKFSSAIDPEMFDFNNIALETETETTSDTN